MGDCTVHPVTVLPTWLDEYIYQEMNAVYDPTLDSFMARELTEDELSRRYLGTYFPRSYAEARSIFTNCFNSCRDCLKDKTEVSILDFGCGTGGDLFGLIDAIRECRPAVQRFMVFWCDVSDAARSVFCQLIAKWRLQNMGAIAGKAFIHDVHAIDGFRCHAKAANSVCPGGYDIVTSFKAINEVYQGGYDGQPYKDFYDVFWPFVNEDGCFCVEDLTFRHPDDSSGVWIPNFFDAITPPVESAPIHNTREHQLFPVHTSMQPSDGQKTVYKLFVNFEEQELLNWSF